MLHDQHLAVDYNYNIFDKCWSGFSHFICYCIIYVLLYFKQIFKLHNQSILCTKYQMKQTTIRQEQI